jgi:hypothetical protein
MSSKADLHALVTKPVVNLADFARLGTKQGTVDTRDSAARYVDAVDNPNRNVVKRAIAAEQVDIATKVPTYALAARDQRVAALVAGAGAAAGGPDAIKEANHTPEST